MKSHFYLLSFTLLLPLITFSQFDVSVNEIADGYSGLCEIVNAGDERLFVVERSGKINILYTDGTKEEEHFLNITDRVESSGNEQGLLGLAFPPNYCSSGVFYVNYTYDNDTEIVTRIARYSTNPNDKNDALENSEEVLLEFEQPFSNHNGGQIEFGPDGYLYIATGDGGGSGDPNNYAQNKNSLLGKLLRIDVSGPTYSIPDNNPFVGNSTERGEIWMYGLRNPWKFAFDQPTGDLYIADVGQNELEEIDYRPYAESAGTNFGWRCYEGDQEYNLSQCDNFDDFVGPVYQYPHNDVNNVVNCSVTGGRVYRGNSFPSLVGKYIAVDFCSGKYFLIWQNEDGTQAFEGDQWDGNFVAFGEDIYGELYAVTINGQVFQVVEGSGVMVDQIIASGSNTISSVIAGSSYTWLLNNEPIIGENEQDLTITVDGTYGLIVTTANGCELDTVTASFVVGVKDHDALEKFLVFPNPAINNISVEVELTVQENLIVQFIDISGRIVSEVGPITGDNLKTIDVSNFQRGIYLIQLSFQDGSVLGRRRIVIE